MNPGNMATASHTEPFRYDVDLGPYNTLNVAANAEVFADIDSLSQLKEVLDHPLARELPVYVLGGGSNVLFAGDVEGLVLHVNMQGREIVRESSDYLWMKAGGGENWHELVRFCVERGWGGLENLALIPGTVGAAPIQNIGAYGRELSEVFHCLRALDLETGEVCEFDRAACRFGYRESIFKGAYKGRYFITDVTLQLRKEPKIEISYASLRDRLREKGIDAPGIKEVFETVMEIRRSKLPDPADLANAGSFFKNPKIPEHRYQLLKESHPDIPGYPGGGDLVKVPAGWLIEKTGWKGRRVGAVGTYRQQALVIVNHGGASGREVLEMARRIKRDVENKFGIALVPEVNIIGE